MTTSPSPAALTEAQLKEAADKVAADRLANTTYTDALIAWESKRDALAFELHKKDITRPFCESRDDASKQLADSKPVLPGISTTSAPAASAPAKAVTPSGPSPTPTTAPTIAPAPAKAS